MGYSSWGHKESWTQLSHFHFSCQSTTVPFFLAQLPDGHYLATLSHWCSTGPTRQFQTVQVSKDSSIVTIRYAQRLREDTEKTFFHPQAHRFHCEFWLHKSRAREAKISLFRKKENTHGLSALFIAGPCKNFFVLARSNPMCIPHEPFTFLSHFSAYLP